MKADSVDAREVFAPAQWIWTLPQGYDLVNYFAQARRSFSLASLPRRATLRITADSRYKLYVNGKYICRGPARGFQQSWSYDTVDVAHALRRGKNSLAVLACSYGIGNNQYIPTDAAGIIVTGKAGPVDLSTGPAWKIRRAPAYARHMTRASRELSFIEIFDARLDDSSWLKPSFDDSSWPSPHCTAPGAMPWHSVEPREIPMLSEKIIAPRSPLAQCTARSAKNWRDSVNITDNYLREKHPWQKPAIPFKRSTSGSTFTVSPSPAGSFSAYVLDFGQEVLGSIRLDVSGASGGEVVDYQVSETLSGLSPDVASPHVDCNVALGGRIILAKDSCQYEQFEPWGFRYLVLVIRNSRRKLSIKASLRTALYPLDVTASFKSSDRALNDIFAISLRAQECCMIDAYIDCPWREQAQWWGDARVQGANTFHLSADSRLFARGIDQISRQEVPNGLTYGLTPANMHHCILPDYTLTWIMTLYDHYRQTGSTELVKAYADRAWRALDYFHDSTAPNGLLPYDPRYWLFLDWADVFKNGYPAVYNIMYFDTLSTAVTLFKLAGQPSRARTCASRADSSRKAILRHLLDAPSARLRDGLLANGKPVDAETPHAYALAVLSGLAPDLSDAFVTEKLLPLVSGPNPKVTGDPRGLPFAPNACPSSFFMHYIFEALKTRGHGAAVVDCIRRWWSVFLDWGFSTTGETFQHIQGRISACHAWSAHPIVHLDNVLLGVTQSALAWKRIDFAPLLAQVKEASGSVATPLGLVKSSWQISGDSAEVSLSLPRGCTARVTLPGVKKTVKAGNHRWRVPVTPIESQTV